jgi:hypothetical protein
MNGVTMRILLVAQAREARRLRGLLNLGTSSQFLVTHAPDLDVYREKTRTSSCWTWGRTLSALVPLCGPLVPPQLSCHW